MKISEIFYSIQGEGFLAGLPSIFIRLAGCPLKCTWCDTKYAWDKESGQELSVEQIISHIEQWPCKNAVITGGEPIIDSDLPRLTHSLKRAGKHITIETCGIEFVLGLECDLMSISPKLSNAGQNNAVNIEALNRFIAEYNYQLKFVV
ncbi:MAG: 7-carboxy-7-deazaguanine synthase QueE, partial [Phycisphaerae bacterium]